MKISSKTLIGVSMLAITMVFPVDAADNVRVSSPSKVQASKGSLREQNATDWVTEAELKKINDEKRASNQQLIYFEYHAGKEKWRGIYTEKVKFRKWSWWIIYGENEMEEKVNAEIAKGLEPAFIAREGNYYGMLFVAPEELPETRKILDEIGIGEPRLRR